MPKLLEQINQDLKKAMIAKEAAILSALRMLVAALRNKEITLRQGERLELTDGQAEEVVSGEIKKRRDAVASYRQGGRDDLADKEADEIKILEKYLPEQMTDDELEKIIKEVMAAGAADFGKVMGQVMARVKGKADGAKVGEMVKRMLGE